MIKYFYAICNGDGVWYRAAAVQLVGQLLRLAKRVMHSVTASKH